MFRAYVENTGKYFQFSTFPAIVHTSINKDAKIVELHPIKKNKPKCKIVHKNIRSKFIKSFISWYNKQEEGYTFTVKDVCTAIKYDVSFFYHNKKNNKHFEEFVNQIAEPKTGNNSKYVFRVRNNTTY